MATCPAANLVLGPPGLGEFHIVIETNDMAQLDRAFQHVASRREPVEAVHHGVNSLVRNGIFGFVSGFPGSGSSSRRREILTRNLAASKLD